MASQGDSGPSPFQSRCYAQDHAAENVASVQQPSESHFASSSSGAGVDHTHQLKRSIDDMSDLEQLTEIENLVRQRKEAIRLQTFGRSPPGLATATVPLRPNSNSVIAPTTPGISQYGAIAPAAALPEEVTSFTFTHNRDKAWHRRIQSNVDVKASMARRSCATRRCRRGDTNDADGPSTYQCTWNCGCSFKRKWEWHRHQENREPQGAWVCFLCCERHEMTPFVNFREDKFFEHLRSKRHSIQKDDTDTLRDLARKSQWSMPRLQRRRCGYGDHVTTGWNEWLKHLEDHYTGRANVRKIRNGEFYDTDENRQSDTRKCYHTDNRSARRLAVPVRDAAGSSKHGPNSANHTKNASRPEGSQGNRSATSKGAHSTHPNYHHSYEMLEFRASKSHVAITITIAELWKGLKHRESLGNGTFCRVEKVSHSRIGDLALKSHDLGKTGTGPAKHIEREIRILSVLNHPNVVRMVTAARKSSEHSFLMWPAAHTDLDKYLRNPTAHSCIAPQDIIGGLTGLACGLHYMHSQSVTHNDIKPENILLDHASFLFADFGAAGEHGPRCRCPRKPQNYMYEAPEVRLGSYAADKADVFSLGLVFTQLLLLLAYGPQSDWSAIQPADTLASRQTSTWVLRFQALKRGVQRLGGVVGQISGRLYRLCHAMTQSSSEKRPTAASVIADLSQALHLLPSAVISYDGVANCAYVGVTRSGRAKRSHGESQPLYVMQPANGARRTGITVHWSMILQHEMQSKLDLYSKRPRLMLASQQLDVNAPSSQDLGTLPPRLLVLSMSEGRAMCKIIEKGGPEWPLMTPRYAALADQTRLAQRAFVEDQGPLQDWTDISQLPHTLHGAAAAALGCGLQYIWVDWLAGLGRSMQITDNTIMTIFRLSSMFMTASFQSMPKSFSQDHNMCHWTTICPLPEFSERYGAGNFAPQAKQPPATRLSRAIILNDLRKVWQFHWIFEHRSANPLLHRNVQIASAMAPVDSRSLRITVI